MLHLSAVLTVVATTLTGCDWIDVAVDSISANIGQQPGHAANPSGFAPDTRYPHRDHTYDEIIAASAVRVAPLTTQQLSILLNHVAMPQSHSAMVGLLGYPQHQYGNHYYWPIEGGSSELAVTYEDDAAIYYTVGY